MKEVITLFANNQVLIIVALLLVDIVLGIIGAIIKKDFVFRKLANFMKGPILGYVLGFAVIEIIGQAIPRLGFIVPAAFVLIVVALVASLIGNLGKWGVPLPKVLKK